MTPRILIADDHAVVRHGVREILAEAFPDASLTEARTVPEVLEQTRLADWDLVVLDVTMPGGSVLDALRAMKQAYPKLPVLVLTIHPEDQFAVRLLRAGAAGYLNKESAPEELVNAARRVLGGGKYISPTLAETLAEYVEIGVERPPHESLSDREYEVLCMIASGKSLTDIAKALGLSIKTISTYRRRILDKMNLRTREDLTRYALHHGLLR